MAMHPEIQRLVETTAFVDTHEHLLEEAYRIERAGKEALSELNPSDFMLLFHAYACSDLVSAGLPAETMSRLMLSQDPPKEKWREIAPYYAHARHTGYVRALRASLRILLGEEDLSEENCERVSERLIGNIKPGYYAQILRETANIEYTQVNGIRIPEKGVFQMTLCAETEYPELLAQDLSTVPLATGLDIQNVSREAQCEVTTLEDWHGVIDWAFATHGPRAIATKNQVAYERRLDFAEVSADDAAPLFARFASDRSSVKPAEFKAIQDHLMHYCIDKAVEYDLPVKLHTGYYAFHGVMPLERVRHNLSDLCPVFQAHPKARFILMHNTYPYQDELIAICKHYPNAYADMCWAWIINPAAGVRFVKEFLMAAPANKLFTFGGDYFCVESVPGHAAIARQGLAQALSELVDEGWLTLKEALELVPQLMKGNAHETFDLERTLE